MTALANSEDLEQSLGESGICLQCLLCLNIYRKYGKEGNETVFGTPNIF